MYSRNCQEHQDIVLYAEGLQILCHMMSEKIFFYRVKKILYFVIVQTFDDSCFSVWRNIFFQTFAKGATQIFIFWACLVVGAIEAVALPLKLNGKMNTVPTHNSHIPNSHTLKNLIFKKNCIIQDWIRDFFSNLAEKYFSYFQQKIY